MEYTIIVASSAAEPASVQLHCAVCGMRHGEYFRDNKKHAVTFYDDLSKNTLRPTRNLTFVASSTRPRSFPWRRLLSSLALAGTRREVE